MNYASKLWAENDVLTKILRLPWLPLVIRMSLSKKSTSKVEVGPGAMGAEVLGPDKNSEIAAAAPGDPHVIV